MVAITVRATYADGVLTPLGPLPLSEGSLVELDVRVHSDTEEPAEPAGAQILSLVDELHRQFPPEVGANAPTDGARNYKHYLFDDPATSAWTDRGVPLSPRSEGGLVLP